MKLHLGREWYSEHSTIGELFIDGQRECFILEPTELFDERTNVRARTCIPTGVYRILISPSPRFGRDLPELQGVPGRSEILIHPGNDPSDTQGCLLPGDYRGVDFVGNSRKTFSALFAKIQAAIDKGEEVWITISDERLS